MIKCFNDFYKNKKVFVTGHTGFKGSWLTALLCELGADVTGYSLETPTNPGLFDILKLKDRINHITGDVRDREKLNKETSRAKPEIILHLAAQPIVRLSYSDPVTTYETNVMGSVNLLEAARKLDTLRAIVIVTSDKCYENREWAYAYRENDPMGGYDPYSSSKGCTELVTSAYRHSFFNINELGKKHNVSLASVRAGNIIGGGDWTQDRLIPDLVKAITAGNELVIRSPEAVRPWQHVLEPVFGYLYLAFMMHKNPKEFSEGFNFGPNSNDILEVRDIVEKALKAWGAGSYRIESDGVLHEAKLLRLDTGKSQFKLKWKPVYNAEQAIVKTIEWYKKYYQNDKNGILEFTAGQIKDYVDNAGQSGLGWIN